MEELCNNYLVIKLLKEDIAVGTTPKRTRGSLTEHSSIRHVARPTFCPDFLKGACNTLKLFIRMTPLSCPDVLSRPSASVLHKSLGRVLWAIIIYTTKSMLDGTLLTHSGNLSRPAPRRLQSEKTEMTTSHPSHNF